MIRIAFDNLNWQLHNGVSNLPFIERIFQVNFRPSLPSDVSPWFIGAGIISTLNLAEYYVTIPSSHTTMSALFFWQATRLVPKIQATNNKIQTIKNIFTYSALGTAAFALQMMDKSMIKSGYISMFSNLLLTAYVFECLKSWCNNPLQSKEDVNSLTEKDIQSIHENYPQFINRLLKDVHRGILNRFYKADLSLPSGINNRTMECFPQFKRPIKPEDIQSLSDNQLTWLYYSMLKEHDFDKHSLGVQIRISRAINATSGRFVPLKLTTLPDFISEDEIIYLQEYFRQHPEQWKNFPDDLNIREKIKNFQKRRN